jgi:hypothetical protein
MLLSVLIYAYSHGVRSSRAIEQIANLVDAIVDAIADGLASAGLRAKLDGLEARKAELARLTAATPHSVPALHPNLAEVYRKRVATLHDALNTGDAPDALEAARALVDRVVIHPPEDGGGPPGVELIGDLLAMMRAGGLGEAGNQDVLATGVLTMFASSVKEGQGGQRPPWPSLPLSENCIPHRVRRACRQNSHPDPLSETRTRCFLGA